MFLDKERLKGMKKFILMFTFILMFIFTFINVFTGISEAYSKIFPLWQKGYGYNTYIQIVALEDDTHVTITFKSCNFTFTQDLGLQKAGHYIYFDTLLLDDKFKDIVGYGTIESTKNIVAIVQIYSDTSSSIIPLND